MEKFNNKPIKPKDASTLIIIKKNKKETLVLMGQRPMQSRFMPGVYVFPGGVTEKEDLQAYKFFKLKPNKQIKKKAVKSYSDSHCQSLLLTAIRETAEETGLYLAEAVKGSSKPFINGDSSWNYFTKKSYIPSIRKLLFFGRAITPSKLKIRFHARFFLAFYEDFLGNMKANRELENLDWISLNEAKNKKIADVTEFMLNEIIKLNNNYSDVSNKRVFPMFTWKNNKRWIKWDKIIKP
jgi:8-oxo-dGTP pyrophosphatase MutT (NUDIX family)